MKADRFWEILDGLPSGQAGHELLRKRLERLGPTELLEFQRMLETAKCSRMHMVGLEAGKGRRRGLRGWLGI